MLKVLGSKSVGSSASFSKFIRWVLISYYCQYLHATAATTTHTFLLVGFWGYVTDNIM